MAAFANSIPIDATRESVESIFARGNYKYLTRRANAANDGWFFQAPHRIGAKDWILVIGFDGVAWFRFESARRTT